MNGRTGLLRRIRDDLYRGYLPHPCVPGSDLEAFLGEHSFGENNTNLNDWRLYTREIEKNKEFAAVYKDEKVLIKGPYTTPEVLQQDLEKIEKQIEKHLVPRKVCGVRITQEGSEILKANISTMTGFSAGAFTYGYLFRDANNLNSVSEIMMSVGSAILGGLTLYVTMVALGRIRERHQALELSSEAEKYLCGKRAIFSLWREKT